jgi:FkbM family methyltransferase
MNTKIAIILTLFLAAPSYAREQSNNVAGAQGPLVASLFNAGDLVFDIGAYVGNKTAFYVAHGARVVCLEPQPSCCKQLNQRFATDKRVTIVPQGVDEKPGSKVLWICSQAGGISTFSEEWRTNSRFSERGFVWDTPHQVAMTTLDLLIEQHSMPAFCKIDVENFEYEVLLGLSQAIPTLSFEVSGETLHNAQKCLDHLERLGYQKFNVGLGEHERLYFKDWMSAHELMEQLRVLADDPPTLWGLWGDIYATVSMP